MDKEEDSPAQAWLRLGEAAEYLGVHPATLRRWADEGQVSCIRTPGGRRRFARSKLDAFLASLSDESSGASNAIEAFTHAPISGSEGHPNLRDEPWYGRIDDARRSAFRRQGQRLMAALMHYAARDDAGETYLDEGSRLAQEYAQLFVNAGLSMPDTVHAFMLVKRSITESLHETGSLNGTPDAATWRIYKRTHDFLDHVLLAMVRVYQTSSR
jgi:excisionase family DNA binding protein